MREFQATRAILDQGHRQAGQRGRECRAGLHLAIGGIAIESIELNDA